MAKAKKITKAKTPAKKPVKAASKATAVKSKKPVTAQNKPQTKIEKKPEVKAKPTAAQPAGLIYSLKEVMDIAFAGNFHNDMTQIFSKKFAGFAFDASKIQRLTTPCVQIIISTAKTCADRNVEFSINNPSEVTEKVFNDLGLAGQLNEWRK